MPSLAALALEGHATSIANDNLVTVPSRARTNNRLAHDRFAPRLNKTFRHPCTGTLPVMTQGYAHGGEENTNTHPRRSSPQAEGAFAASLIAPPADGPLEGAVHPTVPPRSARQHVENSSAPPNKPTFPNVMTGQGNRSPNAPLSMRVLTTGLTTRAITDAEINLRLSRSLLG